MLLYKSAYKYAVGSYLRISGVDIAIRIASDDSSRSIGVYTVGKFSYSMLRSTCSYVASYLVS